MIQTQCISHSMAVLLLSMTNTPKLGGAILGQMILRSTKA